MKLNGSYSFIRRQLLNLSLKLHRFGRSTEHLQTELELILREENEKPEK